MNTIHWKRKLSVALALTLLVSISFVFAERTDASPHYKHYVCLGDSVAAGYTQEATYAYYMQVNPKAYHSLVADAVGADLMQLGWSGTRTEELRHLFDPDFQADEWCMDINSMSSLEHYTGDGNEYWQSVLEGSTIQNYERYYGENFLHDIYNDALKEADLVTLNVGTNDILTFPFMRARTILFGMMSGDSSDSKVSQYLDQVEQFVGEENFPAAAAALFQAARLLGTVAEVAQIVVESMIHGYQRFFENWRPMIDSMKKINPDMTLVVLTLYNPLAKVKILDSDFTRITAMGEMMIAGLNRTIRDYAEEGGYLLADVTGTETWDSRAPVIDIMNFAMTVVTDVHPTNEGHQFITQQILDLLPAQSAFPFRDVAAERWYYPEVQYVWQNGLMQGVDSSRFDPEGITTRAQFAQVLYRLNGAPEVSGQFCPFVDLKDAWYHNAVVWAYQKGVIRGTSPVTFSPNDPITREQMVTMLYHCQGDPEVSSDSLIFPDADMIRPYARNAVAWAASRDIVRGFEDGSFRPGDDTTRAQMAAILHKYHAFS